MRNCVQLLLVVTLVIGAVGCGKEEPGTEPGGGGHGPGGGGSAMGGRPGGAGGGPEATPAVPVEVAEVVLMALFFLWMNDLTLRRTRL